MKLRCADGKVRKFRVSKFDPYSGNWLHARCLECFYDFDVHDLKILKPKFKNHTCQEKKK